MAKTAKLLPARQLSPGDVLMFCGRPTRIVQTATITEGRLFVESTAADKSRHIEVFDPRDEVFVEVDE